MRDDRPADRLPEQRRLVTALFADLSGFTSLSEQLDPETLSDIIGEVITTLSAVVDRYGGTVLNYAGDAVLAGFGVPDSAGDDAERALVTALEMRTALAELLPRLPPIAAGLTLHIGVNSGHAVARYTGASNHVAYTIVGDAVNTAQRLEAAAPTNEIYIGPLTAELGGRMFELEPLAPLTMKGKAEPMPAWRLIARKTDATRLRAHASTEVVGRDDILDRLSTLVTVSQVVALVGEPGIGKTAIVQEAMRRAPGLRWVLASAMPYDAEPYGLWRSVVRTVAGNDSGLVALATGGESDDASAARQRAVHVAVLDVLRDTAPVVVVLDDIQWADPASVELAHELADVIRDRGDAPPIGLVVTARTEALDAARSLVAEAGAAGRMEPVDGLAPARIGDLISGRLGGPASATLTSIVDGRTGGSPFFAAELVQLFADRGQLVLTDGGWDLAVSSNEPEIPPTVEELVQGRLDRLEPGPRSVLELASVIGTTVSVDLLRRASSGTSIAATLDPLLASGLLVQDDDVSRLTFRHGIVRDVAYQCTLRPTRRRLHADVAEAIDATSTGEQSLAELAHHLYLADAGPRAVEALHGAARQAAHLYANASAVDLLDKAVELAARHGLAPREVEDLRMRRASLNALLARTDAALEEFQRLTASPDPEIHRPAALGVARTLRFTGRYDEALGALDELGASDELQQSIVRASVLNGAGRVAESVEVCTGALARCERDTDRIELLLQRAQAYDRLGRADDAFADALLADELARAGDQTTAKVTALRVLGSLYVDHDRLDDAERTLRAGVELATTGGVAFELAGCLANLAFVAQKRGDLPAAIELDRRSVRELHRIRHGFEGGALANLAHKLADAGELDEAAVVARSAVTVARRIGDSFAEADALFALGRTEGEQGLLTEAQASLGASLELLHRIGTTSMVDEIRALLARWSSDGLAGEPNGVDVGR